ncbi:MAG TPA: hypothetical protein VFH02_11785 [Jiangellaceae bacterium]|nr:hypothetical protein [Jiangellaceae bacterium]
MATHRSRHGFNHDHERGEQDGEPDGRHEDRGAVRLYPDLICADIPATR